MQAYSSSWTVHLLTAPTPLLPYPHQASRAWRKNVRAHIVLDPAAGMHTYRSQGQKFGETFSVTPDFPGQRVVLRHVLAPLMAHHTYKTHASPGYKWMLLGDGE